MTMMMYGYDVIGINQCSIFLLRLPDLVEFLVFNSAFGRHRHWLIPITSYSYIIIVMSFVTNQYTGKWSNLPQVGSLSSELIDDQWHEMCMMQFVLISACVCWRSSWTPNTQPGGSSAATWLGFWCSTRLLMSVKKCISYRRKTCSYGFY